MSWCVLYVYEQIKFMGFLGVTTRTDVSTKRLQHPWARFTSIRWDGKIYKAGQYVSSPCPEVTPPCNSLTENSSILKSLHMHTTQVNLLGSGFLQNCPFPTGMCVLTLTDTFLVPLSNIPAVAKQSTWNGVPGPKCSWKMVQLRAILGRFILRSSVFCHFSIFWA